jgi:hypothetical protein
MLCVKLKKYDVACAPTTGGLSRLWIFDRDDFDFTQGAADADGNKPVYTAIARRTAAGATAIGGANLFPVLFQYKEASYSYTQSLNNGTSVKYEHNLEFLLSDISHFITQWNEAVDRASACCGIGVIVELNSGKVLVLAEKYVNAEPIREWRFQQNGSTGATGKLFEDQNGQTTKLVGDYNRGAYEYTGGIAALIALEADDES